MASSKPESASELREWDAYTVPVSAPSSCLISLPPFNDLPDLDNDLDGRLGVLTGLEKVIPRPVSFLRKCPPRGMNTLYFVLVRIATLIPLAMTIWIAVFVAKEVLNPTHFTLMYGAEEGSEDKALDKDHPTRNISDWHQGSQRHPSGFTSTFLEACRERPAGGHPHNDVKHHEHGVDPQVAELHSPLQV